MGAGLTVFDIVALFGSILVAMTVHEAVHAYVGYALGDTTAAEEGRISLNPLHHIDPLTTVVLPIVTLLLFQAPILAAKPVPFNPYRVRYGEWGAALIALAGPLSNFALAVLGAVLFKGIEPASQLGGVLYLFISLNIALGVFNLVPIPPLDGSRVLYAIAPEGLQDIMRQIEPYGFFIVFGLVLLGGFGGALVNVNQHLINLLLQ